MGEVVMLPGVAICALPVETLPAQPNPCVVERMDVIMAKAKAGDLRAFVLVGQMADGSSCEFVSLCEADMHTMDSLLGFAQRALQNDIDERRVGSDLGPAVG